jgi:pimeloyl-ACP methyl ester carboxylesterase
MIHGFDSSCLEYRRLAPLLGDANDVYVPDVLGWGFTDHSGVQDYGAEAKLDHLEAFLEQVVEKPCVLVGASLGGAIAINMATRRPDLVAKLVLIDAQAFIDGEEKSDLPDVFAKFGIGVLKSQPLRMFANYISYTDKSYASMDAMRIGRLHCLMEVK